MCRELSYSRPPPHTRPHGHAQLRINNRAAPTTALCGSGLGVRVRLLRELTFLQHNTRDSETSMLKLPGPTGREGARSFLSPAFKSGES